MYNTLILQLAFLNWNMMVFLQKILYFEWKEQTQRYSRDQKHCTRFRCVYLNLMCCVMVLSWHPLVLVAQTHCLGISRSSPVTVGICQLPSSDSCNYIIRAFIYEASHINLSLISQASRTFALKSTWITIE